MRSTCYCLLFAVGCLLPGTLRAQQVDTLPSTCYRFSLGAGLMRTNNLVYSRGDTYTLSGSVAVLWRPKGDAYWQRFWHNPLFGIKGSYAFINDCPAGDRFGLEGILVNPINRRLEWQFGLGFSFYTKPYQFTHDTNNMLIGSFVNCLIDVALTYHLSDYTHLSFRLLHSSNGMLMRPNQGLNFLQFDLALQTPAIPFSRTPLVREVSLVSPNAEDRGREIHAALSLGAVMARDPDFSGYYPCYDLAIYYQRYLSPVFAFGGAVDLWYNFCDTRHLDREEGVYNLPLYVGAMGHVEMFWGPLSLRVGVGPVIVASPQVTTPIYERAGAYYNLGRTYLGVAVNAHAGRVEFIEWTLGHRFPISK